LDNLEKRYNKRIQVGFLGDVIPGTKSELKKSMKSAREALIEADRVTSINDEIFKNQDGYIEVSPELKEIANFDNEVLKNKKQVNQALRILKNLDNGFLAIQYKDLAEKGKVGGGTLKDLIAWVNKVINLTEDGRPINAESAYILMLLNLATGQKVRWDNELNGAGDIIKKGLAEMVAPKRHKVLESNEERTRIKDPQKKYWKTAANGKNHKTEEEWAEGMMPYRVDNTGEALDIRNAVFEVIERFNSPKDALEELIAMMKASSNSSEDWAIQKYYNDIEREENPEGFYYENNNEDDRKLAPVFSSDLDYSKDVAPF